MISRDRNELSLDYELWKKFASGFFFPRFSRRSVPADWLAGWLVNPLLQRMVVLFCCYRSRFLCFIIVVSFSDETSVHTPRVLICSGQAVIVRGPALLNVAYNQNPPPHARYIDIYGSPNTMMGAAHVRSVPSIKTTECVLEGEISSHLSSVRQHETVPLQSPRLSNHHYCLVMMKS
jgi:hypothetical protein